MKKILLEEELKKIIFLSKYNKSKTLEENMKIFEQNPQAGIKAAESALVKDIQSLSKAEKSLLTKNIDDLAIVGKDGTYIQNSDDLLKKLQVGAIEGKELAKAQQAIFKSTSNPKIIDGLAPKFAKNMNQSAIEAKRLNRDLRSHLKQNGYGEAQINALQKANPKAFESATAKEIKQGAGQVKGQQVVKNEQAAEKALANTEAVDTAKKLGKWERFKNWVKANPKKAATWFGVGVTIGALAIFWKQIFPDEVLPVVDSPTADTPATGGGGGTGTGSTFRTCNDFPYTQGCRSEVVREIQNCLKTDANGNPLRADGLFGPRTAGALTKQGYATEVTKEVYDKIKANCGGTSSVGTTTSDTWSEDPFAGTASSELGD